MPSKVIYERFLWFHSQVKAGKYPNAGTFLQQFLTFHSLNLPVSFEEFIQKVSVKNIEYSRFRDTVFQKVVDALFYTKPLSTLYYSPHKDETTQRDILPLHLLQYMGNRHIIAHCSLRDKLRDFALSRIQFVEPSTKKIKPDISSGFVKEYMRKNFGLFSSEISIEVCLKFSADISPWVSEQVWHSEQKRTKHSDGSLCLAFPVADFKEIKREVLKYGSQVEVLSPQQLRDEVKKEIEKMKKIRLYMDSRLLVRRRRSKESMSFFPRFFALWTNSKNPM